VRERSVDLNNGAYPRDKRRELVEMARVRSELGHLSVSMKESYSGGPSRGGNLENVNITVEHTRRLSKSSGYQGVAPTTNGKSPIPGRNGSLELSTTKWKKR